MIKKILKKVLQQTLMIMKMRIFKDLNDEKLMMKIIFIL